MSEITPALIKGLFFHLVKAVGGVETAGAFLGISHQRVSQLQAVHSADMPSIIQIATLEGVVQQDIVTGHLSRVATGQNRADDMKQEAVQATAAVVAVQTAVFNGCPQKELLALALKARAEVDDVVTAASA